MNIDSKECFELRRLIIAAQAGEISEDEADQLDALILRPGGADVAAALIDQMSSLEDVTSLNVRSSFCSSNGPRGNVCSVTDEPTAAADPVITTASSASTSAATSPATSTASKHRIPVWLVATGAAVLLMSHLSVGALSWSLAQNETKTENTSAPLAEGAPSTTLDVDSSQQQDPAGTNPPRDTKSYLVSTTACVWFPSMSSMPRVGQSVQTGEMLSLIEGIAELGVGPSGNDRVRIEGPASVYIQPDGQLSLQSGALTADIADGNPEGLIVKTPIGTVRASSGASTGLVVNLDSVELHVFRGRVSIAAKDYHAGKTPIELVAGEAVRFTIDARGELEIIFQDASANEFASARSMGFDPLNIGDVYINAVKKSDPAIYWRFENTTTDFPRRIVNHGNLGEFDATIHGDVHWRRYASNRVAEFGLSDNPSVIVSAKPWPAKPLSDYTIELWMKPTCFHHGTAFCLTKDNPEANNGYDHGLIFEVGARHWSTLQHLKPNRVRYVHRTPISNQYQAGTYLLSRDVYKVRTWQHWVMRKQGGTITLTVDGEVVDENKDPTDLSPGLNLVIGQLYPTLSQRPFIGQIDEVAVYERFLSDAELLTHFQAANQRPPIKPNSRAAISLYEPYPRESVW
ncbi:MAG: LamG domain-containing protein [Rhodopirellula sp. JB044]|uniref:LamG domain-containing protein n=1 Tax=Rhodopirellula sp. JB044 TaxID=3342844 RepID=UPI00370CEE00